MCIKSEFKEICLKLATNGRSDEGFLLTSKVCPQWVFCPFSGAIYMFKIIKMCIKSDFEEIILKLATYGQREKAFLLSSKFWLKWIVCPCRGYIHMVKHEKNVYKIGLQKQFFLNLQQMGKVIKAFCWHQKFVPKGLSALAPGLYTYIKSLKMCLKSYFKEIVLKLATNGQSDKGFLLTSIFVPKGLSAPALGLYTCIKTLKYIPGPDVRWAFTGPLVLWFFLSHQNFLQRRLQMTEVTIFTCLLNFKKLYQEIISKTQKR